MKLINKIKLFFYRRWLRKRTIDIFKDYDDDFWQVRRDSWL